MDPPSFYAAAVEAASLLIAGERGVLLTGSPRQADATIALILDRLDTQTIMPVRFLGDLGTPAALRARVAHMHAARRKPDTRLLLIISDADAMQPELLQELELAAEAAAQYGGLQFLFGSNRHLRLMLQNEAFFALAFCFDSRIQLPLPGRPGALDVPATRTRLPALHSGAARAAIAASATFLILGGIFFTLRPSPPDKPRLTVTAMGTPPAAKVVAAPTPIIRQAANKPMLVNVAGPNDPPPVPMAITPSPALNPRATQLLLVAGPGDTLRSLYQQVYQGRNAPAFAVVAANNPQEIRPGTRLVFPAPADGWHLSAGP